MVLYFCTAVVHQPSMLKTQLYRCLIYLIGHLPLAVIRSIGASLGGLAWLLRSRMSLVTRQNIQLCYPNLDPHRQNVLSRESLQETSKTMAETCFAWVRSPEKVLGLIHEVQGKDLVDQYRAKGFAVVFVIPHQGNWEVINHYLGKHYGLTHMFQPNRNRHLSQYIQSKRAITGTRFVPTDRSGIKSQLKILRSGGCIGVMPDQEPLVHTGDFAPFFGIPALTNELIKGYARTNSKMFTAVCERSNGGFNVKLVEIPEVSEATALARVNQGIEDAIRLQPAQYLWSYKRFRTRPDGNLDYYHIDQHPIRTWLESISLSLYEYLLAHLAPKSHRALASLTPLLGKRSKISKINLKLTNLDASLAKPSMQQTKQAAIEAPWIWHANQDQFNQRLSVLDKPDLDQGGMVLTPPLGSREALFRYLSNVQKVTEYYHSNSIESLDRLIRTRRTAFGIGLVGHDEAGRQQLKQVVNKQQVITLCPDQQPRLRGGLFVDFFDHPALTAIAIAEILKETACPLFLGYAPRTQSGFEPRLEPISFDPSWSDEQILKTINSALESAIRRYPEQYRWSDKRFNIQPLGMKKVYR